jgi:hypothetical protein
MTNQNFFAPQPPRQHRVPQPTPRLHYGTGFARVRCPAVLVVAKVFERFALGCMTPVHVKRQPAKENSRLIPYMCSGTAPGLEHWP